MIDFNVIRNRMEAERIFGNPHPSKVAIPPFKSKAPEPSAFTGRHTPIFTGQVTTR